jgi:hypothetical protein
VAGHIFQARTVWIYTQSNITNINLKKFLPTSKSDLLYFAAQVDPIT